MLGGAQSSSAFLRVVEVCVVVSVGGAVVVAAFAVDAIAVVIVGVGGVAVVVAGSAADVVMFACACA